MREIKFRGRSKQSGVWFVGSLLMNGTTPMIIGAGPHDLSDIDFGWAFEEVEAETVGEYIGLQDKNGKEIFEGDIIRINSMILVAQWGERQRSETHGHGDFSESLLVGFFFDGYFGLPMQGEIIGNIHENPGLLE